LHPSRQGGEFLNIFSVAFAIFGKSEASLALSRALSRTAGIPLYEIRGCV